MCFNELVSFNNVFNNIKSDGGVEFSVKFSDLKNIHTLHNSKDYQYILFVLTLLLIVVFMLLNNPYVHIHPRRQMVGVT